MVNEVTSNGSINQTMQPRGRELEQAQRVRETRINQSNQGVEVRISQQETQRARGNDSLTYENIRPRNGTAPQVERGNEPQETDQTPRTQLETVRQERVQAREPQRASEVINDLT